MDIYAYAVISGLFIALASLGGIFFTARFAESTFQRNSTLFLSGAIGVFAVVAYSLFREAAHESLMLWDLILYGLCGAFFLHLLANLIPGAHHHHDTGHHKHDHNKLDVRRLLTGDAIHNIGDGIILVPAYLVDVRFGIVTTISIFLHEFAQEVAQYFILRNIGYSARKALTYNFIISLTIFVGIGISLNIALTGQQLGMFFAFAGGAFLYVILRDLLPHVLHVMECSKKYILYPTIMIAGAIIMAGVSFLSPHDHITSGDGHDDHDLSQEHSENHEEDTHGEHSDELSEHPDEELL